MTNKHIKSAFFLTILWYLLNRFGMCIKVIVFVILVLVVPSSTSYLALQDETEQEYLKRRYENYKVEEKEYIERKEKNEIERKKKLASLGIEGVELIGSHGDPSRRVDIVFIGDGFTKEEQKLYNDTVDAMIKNFNSAPFMHYPSLLNFYRINLISNRSGVSTDNSPETSTLGGFATPGQAIPLRCNQSKVIEYVKKAVLDIDYIFVVFNITPHTNGGYAGAANADMSMGFIRTSTFTGHLGSLVLHEFGHPFGHLLDEYVDPNQSKNFVASDGSILPAVKQRIEATANVGLDSNVYLSKWHYWNIPEDVFKGKTRGKSFKWEDVVRCYEGAATITDGVHRAEENCHMQRGRGRNFCRVCVEQVEKCLYNFITPLESVIPSKVYVNMNLNKGMDFEVIPAQIDENLVSLRISWYKDGELLDGKKMKVTKDMDRNVYSYKLKGAEFGLGKHSLTAHVNIDSPKVRIDNGGLSASFTWLVDILGGPNIDIPKYIKTNVGKEVLFTVKKKEKVDLKLLLENPPRGATFGSDTLEFKWTPDDNQHGAYRLKFVVKYDKYKEDFYTDISVISPVKENKLPPRFLFIPVQSEQEGGKLLLKIEAYDPDEDSLIYSAENLPEGAVLNPDTGDFEWDIDYSQKGVYNIEFTVSDGINKDKKSIRFVIGGVQLWNSPYALLNVPYNFKNLTDTIIKGLHCLEPKVRIKYFEQISSISDYAKLFESIRFLRDRDSAISKMALDNLKGILNGTANDSNYKANPAYIKIFIDEIPYYIWQSVDRVEILDALYEMVKTLDLREKNLPSKLKNNIKDFFKDVELIRDYNQERKNKTPLPPITDKKYK